MKHFLDSGNDELFATIDEPRTNESGYLIETCKDEDFPSIGYSDPFVWWNGGNMTQLRLLYFNGKYVGQEVTFFPWNILQGVELYYEINVDDSLDFRSDFYGKPVSISHYDENCVVFECLSEFMNHPIIKYLNQP